MSVHQHCVRVFGERCAACSESQWQRAPTLMVASVVECPRLATGLAVYIEASPGRISKTEAQNAGPRGGGAREWLRGGSQQKEHRARIRWHMKPDMKWSDSLTVISVCLSELVTSAAYSLSSATRRAAAAHGGRGEDGGRRAER